MSDMIEALRELHGPVGDYYLKCEGCDAEGYEQEAPFWPCRSAELLYSAEEIAQIEAQAKTVRDRIQAERAKLPTRPPSMIQQIYAPEIITQLQNQAFFSRRLP